VAAAALPPEDHAINKQETKKPLHTALMRNFYKLGAATSYKEPTSHAHAMALLLDRAPPKPKRRSNPHTSRWGPCRFHLGFGLVLTLALVPTNARAANGEASFGLRPVRSDPARPATKSYFIYDAILGQQLQD